MDHNIAGESLSEWATEAGRSLICGKLTRRQALRIAAAATCLSLTPFRVVVAAPVLRLRHELRGAWGEIFDAVFSSDGRSVAFACYDFEVEFSARVFRLADGEPVQEQMIAHPQWMTRIAFQPKGDLFGIGDVAGKVTLVSPGNEQTVRTLTTAGATVHDLAFSPDGSMLAAASGAVEVDVWQTSSGDRLRSPVTGTDQAGVESVAFHPLDELLAVGHADGRVRLIATKTMLPVGLEITDHHDKLVRLAYSADGGLLAAAGGATITVWESRSLGTVLSRNTGLAPIKCVALSPNGAWLAYGYGGGDVVLRELGSGQQETSIDAQDGSYVSSVAFSPDGSLLAAAGGAGKVMIWEIRSS